MKLFTRFIAIAMLLLACGSAFGQTTASLTGTVTTAGSPLPGVTITATQTETGLKRDVTSEVDGTYTILNLPPGAYTLEAMLQGFRSFQQTGITLQVGATPVINITMPVGQVAETITVQANASLVETKNLGVGQVMTNKQVVELPLNGRNTADLLALLPASVSTPAGNATSRSMQGSQGGIAYSLAGDRRRAVQGAPRHRFSQHEDVRDDARFAVGKHRAGAKEPRRDLVEDEERAVLVARVARRA